MEKLNKLDRRNAILAVVFLKNIAGKPSGLALPLLFSLHNIL